jgi:hypothetical protein
MVIIQVFLSGNTRIVLCIFGIKLHIILYIRDQELIKSRLDCMLELLFFVKPSEVEISSHWMTWMWYRGLYHHQK